jgi:predicted O-methyltransferase YrrM
MAETLLSPSPLVSNGTPLHIISLLKRLHAESLRQESAICRADYDPSVIHSNMRDKFIALEEDKCLFVYQLARSINAKYVVEAGTSYGVSTIYLALAVSENIRVNGGTGGVIGTEHEPEKAKQAIKYWEECGDSIASIIELREGDLRETLKEGMDSVDLLLLDSEFPICFNND